MSLIEVDRNVAVVAPTTKDKLVSIVFEGPNRWLCIWIVDGKEKQIPVSDATRELIKARVSFKNLIGELRDDTHPRAIV